MNDIETIVRYILTKRFSDPKKQQIGKKTSNRINFSCPYCGDSNSAEKKRGNIYFSSKTFKCFNDGCPKNFCSVYEFITHWAHKFSIDIAGIDASDFQPDAESFDTTQALNTLRNDIINDKLIDTDELVNRFNLKNIDQAPKHTSAYIHAKHRFLFDIPHVHLYIKTDSFHNKLYFINRDIKTNKLIGVYIRNLEHGIRYKMIKYHQILNALGYQAHFTSSELDMINYGASYFNITNVDFNQSNVKLVEGQIDSLFLNNSIGVSGISKSKNLINYISEFTKCYIVVDEDQTQFIMHMLRNNHYVLLWDYLKHRLQSSIQPTKDNWIKFNQNLDINDLYQLLKRSHSALTVNKFDKLINRFVSNNIIDAVLI
jgi:hypothetical protein